MARGGGVKKKRNLDRVKRMSKPKEFRDASGLTDHREKEHPEGGEGIGRSQEVTGKS